MVGIADQTLAIDDEPGVQTAEPTDAADDLLAGVGDDLPEQALIAQAREHLHRVVGLAMVGGNQAGPSSPVVP